MSLKAIFALTSALWLTSCATAPTVISDYCENDRVIRPSRKDTQGTLNQVAVHNAKWRALCAQGAAK